MLLFCLPCISLFFSITPRRCRCSATEVVRESFISSPSPLIGAETIGEDENRSDREIQGRKGRRGKKAKVWLEESSEGVFVQTQLVAYSLVHLSRFAVIRRNDHIGREVPLDCKVQQTK